MDIVGIEHSLGQPIDVATKSLGIVSTQGSNPAFDFEDEWIGYSFFRPQGFALSFCDAAFYRDDETTPGDEKILTTVLFYNDERYYHHKDYHGNLPLGIVFSDDHASVMARLGAPGWKFVADGREICARWDVDDYWVLVFYNAAGHGIKHIQVGWNPPAPVAPTALRVKLHGQPDFDVARALFKRTVSDAQLTGALRGFALSEVKSAKPDDWYVQVDNTTGKGVELFFDQPRLPDPPGDFLFSGLKYFRRGIFGSPGFAGRLPHGIEFSFKPERLLQLLGNPVTGSANEHAGYYVWNFEDYLLHVMFSVQEQRVDRVTVMLHPYHSDSFLKDNPLSDLQL